MEAVRDDSVTGGTEADARNRPHTSEAGPGSEPGNAPLPPFARGPVGAVAGAVLVLLAAVAGRFGYFADELYFIAAGEHPAWGYVDQPPLMPLMAQALDALSGGSLVVLRLPVALATAAGVVVTALIVRELGGGRAPQVLGALAYALSPTVLQAGHYFTTGAVDLFLGTVTCLLLVRWANRRADRLLLWAGLVTAVQLNVKYTGAAFWVVLFAVVLVTGPRTLLRRPALWGAAALVTLTLVPGLLWQASHGWPQLEMTDVISEQVRASGGKLTYLPSLLWGAGIAGSILLVVGFWRLLRSPEWARYRFLGWTVAVLAVLYFVADGRPYYLAPAFALLWAVGAVELDRARSRRWWRPVMWPAALLSLLVVSQILPLYPQSVMKQQTVDPLARETVGWPLLADAVAAEYRRLPADRRASTVVLTDTFGQAGALHRFREEAGLPAVYSGHRGYRQLGRPADGVDGVLYVGADADWLRKRFGDVRKVATFDNGLGIDNRTQGVPIWLCTEPTEPWDEGWDRFAHLEAVRQ